MTQKELNRAEILSKVKDKRLKQRQAAEKLFFFIKAGCLKGCHQLCQLNFINLNLFLTCSLKR